MPGKHWRTLSSSAFRAMRTTVVAINSRVVAINCSGHGFDFRQLDIVTRYFYVLLMQVQARVNGIGGVRTLSSCTCTCSLGWTCSAGQLVIVTALCLGSMGMWQCVFMWWVRATGDFSPGAGLFSGSRLLPRTDTFSLLVSPLALELLKYWCFLE